MAKVFLYGLSVFYILAGINHFVSPDFYYALIPDYLPWKPAVNLISGVAEIALGASISFAKSRRIAGLLLIAMLLTFVPSHIYFIQLGSCITEVLCVPEWVGWLRLVVIHPLLIIWAYWAGFRYRS